MHSSLRKKGVRVQKVMCSVTLFLWVVLVIPAHATAVKVMLLGDSITAGFEGSDPIGGFRNDLDSMLVEVGSEHDFVGTCNDGQGFDADHEGHGGWTVDMILADIDSFLNVTDPEMILIHLGTNDISANQGVSSTLVEMDSLLEHIYNYRTTMIVHLSGLIPRNDSTGTEKDSLTTELNEGYLGIVSDWLLRGFDIKYVDHNSAFKADPNWRDDYLFDHVHPNNTGYALMAQTYFDSLASENIFDNVPPAMITDLTVESLATRTALLRWTATGDDGYVGTADRYDMRYWTSPITETNFSSAMQAVGEPDPSPSGSAEEFTVGGLDPGVTYYFALKAMDEANNASPLSNVPSGETQTNHTLLDDFERPSLGSDWNADPEFIVSSGELSNESLEDRWDFMAVYTPVKNAEAISLRWGTGADNAGIGEGGLALMLDSPSPNASGYLIFRHRIFNYYALWTIINGAPDIAVAQSPVSTLPYPQAGDVFEVVVSSDSHGHHFDCYINGEYDTRVSDPGKLQGNGADSWSGTMLHGDRNNNLEDFWVRGLNVNLPPASFNLSSPIDGSRVETGMPLLDWEDSIDPNLSDSVLYTLYYGTSAVFAPESTTVVDNLSGSEYTVPPINIFSLVRGSGHQSDSKLSPSPSSLPDDAVIYWKVKAVDTGSLETWSQQQDWSFTVSIPEPPFQFGLLNPSIGDTVETLTPLLIWQSTSDPDPGDEVTYTAYYDTVDNFPDPITISGLTDTTFTLPPLNDNTLYYWKIEAVDGQGLTTRSIYVYYFFVLTPTAIGDSDGIAPPGLPKVFALAQNYPNPFNPSTSIRYDVPAGPSSDGGVHVLLQIYTLRGQLVKTLEDGVKVPGSYVVNWNGRDENGERAGSGIYLYRIQAGTFRATKKMVVVK